ncbi:MAG TPA: hypothetical protein VGJ95_12755 [Pseudonocardiaceae bacterium]|jgi:hypothetical protein
MFGLDYTARHRSMLRAVAQGRAQLTSCGHPELCVDGLWCDQTAAGELVRNGLVRPARQATVGALVPALLTAAGATILATLGQGAQAV